jgi:hypothetical protein
MHITHTALAYPNPPVHPGPYAASGPPSRALATFTQEELLQAGNYAYISLFERFNTLKSVPSLLFARLLHAEQFPCRSAYDQLVASLTLTASATPASTNTSTRSVGTSSPLPPAPVLLPCLPYTVRFPTQQSFIGAHGRKEIIVRKYLESAKGDPLTEERICVICRIIHRFWRNLVKGGLLLLKWGEIDGLALEWLKLQVYSLCPELWFCTDDWKLLYYCQGHYSSWRTKHIGNAGNVRKRDSDDEDADEESHPSAKRKCLGMAFAF